MCSVTCRLFFFWNVCNMQGYRIPRARRQEDLFLWGRKTYDIMKKGDNLTACKALFYLVVRKWKYKKKRIKAGKRQDVVARQKKNNTEVKKV